MVLVYLLFAFIAIQLTYGCIRWVYRKPKYEYGVELIEWNRQTKHDTVIDCDDYTLTVWITPLKFIDSLTQDEYAIELEYTPKRLLPPKTFSIWFDQRQYELVLFKDNHRYFYSSIVIQSKRWYRRHSPILLLPNGFSI